MLEVCTLFTRCWLHLAVFSCSHSSNFRWKSCSQVRNRNGIQTATLVTWPLPLSPAPYCCPVNNNRASRNWEITLKFEFASHGTGSAMAEGGAFVTEGSSTLRARYVAWNPTMILPPWASEFISWRDASRFWKRGGPCDGGTSDTDAFEKVDTVEIIKYLSEMFGKISCSENIVYTFYIIKPGVAAGLFPATTASHAPYMPLTQGG